MLQLVSSFVGGGDTPDDIPDVDIQTDHGIGSQFLTIKNLIGFFTVFSWAGIASIDSGLSVPASLVVATFSGLAMMSLMAGAFYLMSRMNVDGTMKIASAIGHSGEVYLSIHSNRRNIGKVQIKVNGALRTLDAVTDDEHDIATGKLVTVSAIVNDSLLLVTQK
jgi:hypothetical protein